MPLDPGAGRNTWCAPEWTVSRLSYPSITVSRGTAEKAMILFRQSSGRLCSPGASGRSAASRAAVSSKACTRARNYGLKKQCRSRVHIFENRRKVTPLHTTLSSARIIGLGSGLCWLDIKRKKKGKGSTRSTTRRLTLAEQNVGRRLRRIR